jgi:hypothetical protein
MILRLIVMTWFLSACGSAAEPNTVIYPIDRAREDGDWTLLYRDVPLEISKDGYVIFMIPAGWTPLGLKDTHHLRAEIARDEETSVITLTSFKP